MLKLCLATLKDIKYFWIPLCNALLPGREFYECFGVHKSEFSEKKMAEKLLFRYDVSKTKIDISKQNCAVQNSKLTFHLLILLCLMNCT